MTMTQAESKPSSDTVICPREWSSHTGEETYSNRVDSIRSQEYPTLQDAIYLDHAATTPYAKSLIEAYSLELSRNLFGNPHSASASSQRSSRIVEDTRLSVLKFVNADPEYFDVVFLANATAAIKLVADAFHDSERGFWYGYHGESHTSLVGVRELASGGSDCFPDDAAAQNWISNLENTGVSQDKTLLFAYPGQSNMTGRRLPFEWCSQIRHAAELTHRQAFSLFDAAALASTSPIDLGDARSAPDFTALSFYKIFGFPDLGALVVRKASGHMLRRRKYFAGGTVDTVSACDSERWHINKVSLDCALDDGTLPFHSIIALGQALKVHTQLYGSMHNIASHTKKLCNNLHSRMVDLRHINGQQVCRIYGRQQSELGNGPVIAFNILDSSGKPVSNIEVEKLAAVKNVHLRTGGLCNPGGIARHLDLNSDELKANYAAGRRCGGEQDILNGKSTGVIRVSLGAMSSMADIDYFLAFLEEFFVSRDISCAASITRAGSVASPRFFIDSMAVFPIKSCAAFKVPVGVDWNVSAKGLAYDREWCLLHQGTNTALNQKQYPRMALIQPTVDVGKRLLTVSCSSDQLQRRIHIDLDDLPTIVGALKTCRQAKRIQSLVCGESVLVYIYAQSEINDFFSEVLGVPCVLARYPHADDKPRYAKLRRPKSKTAAPLELEGLPPTIKLSNESPILLISRSSVNRLNQQVKQYHPLAQEILADSFRANIIVSERSPETRDESPYVEDSWQKLSISGTNASSAFNVLGPCQRCQMVCVDQNTAMKRPEPFSTLAKTRRWDGGVWFGMHLCLSEIKDGDQGGVGRPLASLRVGDHVYPS